MTAAFSSVFVFALIVNIITTLWSSFRNVFGKKTLCSADAGDKNDEECASRKLVDEERRKNAKTVNQYLSVYLLAVFSDWVKGPYGYELYSSGDYYNYNPREIYILCSLIPFASSIAFGTFVCGPLADNGFDFRRGVGRKQMVLVFALVTTLSNITKHFRNFKASVTGAILEGISTSLLFTGFDSWLVRSFRCNAANISSFSTSMQTKTQTSTPTPSLQLSRALATSEYRNNIVAISAGWIATLVAEMTDFQPLLGTTEEIKKSNGGDNAILYVGGVLNPFDLSSFALFLCAILALVLWDKTDGKEVEEEKEKRPDHQSEGDGNEANSSWWQRYRSSFSDAFLAIINSKEILLTGLICALFESAMFIFVFTWTNALVPRMEGQQEIPFSLIFATFMFGCMTGTSMFTVLIDDMKIKNERIGKVALFAATCAFIGMAFARSTIPTMIAFFLFELSVGVYFPMMGTMKSEIVPEKHRTTIYNIYRIPFNVVMIIFLSWLGDSSSYLSLYSELPFAICACMVGTSFFLQGNLCKYQQQRKVHHPSKQPQTILSSEFIQQKKMS